MLFGQRNEERNVHCRMTLVMLDELQQIMVRKGSHPQKALFQACELPSGKLT